ncbi:hypothetical protein TNCV_3211151 [Trichonephila clavipes]|uniref:Uncharacterized protein n=1 Tax=Trichonephila clavipes TaxID=2585209 RepID=A0A8X6S5X4_TRICX|nr:hypothetical protein TNCV_3211151 [Trichonephila clavipes]
MESGSSKLNFCCDITMCMMPFVEIENDHACRPWLFRIRNKKIGEKAISSMHPDKNNGCEDNVENLQLQKESYDVFMGKEECSLSIQTSSTSGPFDE